MLDFTDHLKPTHDGTAALQAERDGSSYRRDPACKTPSNRDGFLERQEKVLKALSKEKLFDKDQQLNLSRTGRYQLGLARAKAIQRLIRGENWSYEDSQMAENLNDEMSPYCLHMSMFVTTTELGHGSNVRGLETTVKWGPIRKEFDFLTASKWWNGSMGRTATHAIVVAQLLLPKPSKARAFDPPTDSLSDSEYDSHGPQTFTLQIRDEKSHQPLPGIAVGDIGPKYGYASMKSGYMLFDHYRVPRSAMLSRYVEISGETGAFIRTGHPADVYGSLTFVRGQIIMHARLVLARAVTVAVRYCSIRRQLKDWDSKSSADQEMKVLDYPTVQIRILPLLATTFALHYTGESMYMLYHKSRETIEKGNFGPLAELHSASSGLKSVCTTLAADGIETCCRAMGGHGFGGGSGLVGLNSDYLSKVAAYLIKKMGEAVKDPSTPARDPTDSLSQSYSRNRDNRIPQSIVKDDSPCCEKQKPWKKLMIQLHSRSRAYFEPILITNFYNSFSDSGATLSSPTPDVLRLCFHLYALCTLDQFASSFTMTTAVLPESVYDLQDAILNLMSELRPHAVKLVDACSIPDWLLKSALGRSDGRVYEELFDMAHPKNPLNKVTFNPDLRSEEIVLGSGDGGRHVLAKL
ncbi:acyl-CoA oxidase [Plenodomus tracheiphilus IPT5]|uniref:Acyl-coenzyme A oxidase n=1 Tax=Plenodomus tracheiphilus IPT5 TaxID=1408161 RepID=A0A6A7B1L1_9PLEO|nr:acyl-CoA oxidase [Plenodomus tracheiphilus IPT5]